MWPNGKIAALIAGAQHRASAALGIDERRRGDTVVAMQENNARRAPGYWIQLFLSMGIATLGLVLDSTAVVIGAMLVSPLMGPILELGMGFAVGSSLLVLRAFLRVGLSVLLVVAGAALFTLALPFHEVTAEISARAAPTALDLLVAVFCALTAAYTTVRPGSDSIAAAAGTAIGIALVPPLCTIGFGLGTGAGDIASGAALLFVANLSAILVFAVLSFLALGFNQVDAESIEAGFLAENAGDGTRSDRVAAWVHRLLRTIFGSRYGLAMRVAVPMMFLAAVFVPLRRALDEVTWEVHSRAAIRRIVAAASPGAVQTSVAVERHTITLRLLVVASSDSAAALESMLTRRIQESAGVAPSVSVVPVADTRMLAAAAAAEAREQTPPPEAPAAALTGQFATVVHDVWPGVAGPLVGWDAEMGPHGQTTIAVRHLGASLGAAGSALLATTLSARLGSAVTVRDEPIAPEPIVARKGGTLAWSDSALVLLASVAAADSLVACVRAPATDTTGRAGDRAILAKLRASNAAQGGRMVIAGPGPWAIRAALVSCAADTVR